MRLRDVRKAILKGLAGILGSTAEALRRQAQGREGAPDSRTEAAGKEAGGPPAHWLERVKDARVWYGTDGKKPGKAAVPASRYAPQTKPPMISKKSSGTPPPAKDIPKRSTKQSDAGQSRRARKEQESRPEAEDPQPKIELPGSKKTTETQPPAGAVFRLRRAGDSPNGGEGKSGGNKRKQPLTGRGGTEQPVSQPRVLRPQLHPADQNDSIYRSTDPKSGKTLTAGGNGTPRIEGRPLSTQNKPDQTRSPRTGAGPPEQAWKGLHLNPPGSGSLDDGSSLNSPPRTAEWSPPPARVNVPEQNNESRDFGPTARAREIWPDLSRENEGLPRATSAISEETGAFAPSARSRWPDLPIDTSDLRGTEAARERWEAEQRERQHEQKLVREQRGDLWSE